MRTDPIRRIALAAALGAAGIAAACGESGGGQTTQPTVSTIPTAEFCENGKDLAAQVQVLDKSKPDYLDNVKRIFRQYGSATPAAISDDFKAYVDYIQGVTSIEQLPAVLARPGDRMVVFFGSGHAFLLLLTFRPGMTVPWLGQPTSAVARVR